MYRLQCISKVQRYNLANFNGTNPQAETCKCSLTKKNLQLTLNVQLCVKTKGT